jgi:proline-specific peptidase
MVTTEQREGYVDAPGGKVWYKVVGDGPGAPLLVLHGGPGAGHDYLEPLEVLGDERPVVFYDQLGCGKSDIPDDESLWVIDRFVREVDAVRAALGLESVHLLGQSWGGFLAIEYMVTAAPKGIVSLTLASTCASVSGFIAGCKGLVAQLPAEVQETLARCEAEGDTQSPAYEAASGAFYQAYLCRLDPWPEATLRSMTNVRSSPVYPTMWGPAEFECTGTLGSWERADHLGAISVATLITSGRYDEMVPALQEQMRDAIAGSKWVCFENSSHSAHAEEPEEYARVLREFLGRTEAA